MPLIREELVEFSLVQAKSASGGSGYDGHEQIIPFNGKIPKSSYNMFYKYCHPTTEVQF